jgi:hypothetical protein
MKLPLLFGLRLPQMFLGAEPSPAQCKTMPGDPGWPNAATWERFNASVDGHLIRTVPIASPCHGPDQDTEKCGVVKNLWHRPMFQ